MIKTADFSELKQAVAVQLNNMKQQRLFYVSIDRDTIWETYLNAYPEALRQEHNCNCCKSFLRQFGGLVTIDETFKVTSIWDDLTVDPLFKTVTDSLSAYIHSLPVSDIFLTESTKCGTDKNYDEKLNVTWSHLYLSVPQSAVAKKDSISVKKAEARDDMAVLKRSLDELTQDATETVLELIGQNSLYRGKEFDGLLNSFVLLQRRYKRLEESQKQAFAWINSFTSRPLARIRNTAIGTLLIDLSAGVELDVAVTKFEKVMAPANYKRPTALTTPKMVEAAKETIKSLGLLESLNRRFATETDIRACDVIFKDTPQALTDVFDEVAKETTVSPRTFAKVEEISIADFINNVVPTAKSISVLLENGHQGNMVSLVTAQDPQTPSLFKWDNNFSWSYTGSVTDSIKERVKEAGGNVVGELRASLSWFNSDDLDLHCEEPGGGHIFYGNKGPHKTSGQLDVDMNAGFSRNDVNPVENIIWTDKARMKEGVYSINVNNFSKRTNERQGFVVQIECNGEIFDFEYKASPKGGETIRIISFEYTKKDGFKQILGDTKNNSVVSREKWGIKTNQFHKVTKLLLSPNQWDKPIGNKHYLFMLEGCLSDESPRSFFNEFLKTELDQHRKVFEVVGGKLKIEHSASQLSGIGFSETQRASLIAKVTGKFTRTLRVQF